MFGEVSSRPFEQAGVYALVQCWECNHHETRKVGIVGRPEEIRCSECDGPVEVLELNDG